LECRSPDLIKAFMKQACQIAIAKTSNHSVLSSMNQIVYEYPYIWARYAHLGDDGRVMVNREMNRMLRGAIGKGRHDYGEPFERFAEMVAGKKP